MSSGLHLVGCTSVHQISWVVYHTYIYIYIYDADAHTDVHGGVHGDTHDLVCSPLMKELLCSPLLNHLLCDPFLIDALYRAFLIELLYYDLPVSQSVHMCGTEGVAWALERVTTLQKILRARVIIMIVENWATVSVLSEVHSSKRAQFDAQSLGFWDTYFWIVRRILLYFEAHIFEVSWVGSMVTSHKNININICWIDLKNQLFRQVLKNQLQARFEE